MAGGAAFYITEPESAQLRGSAITLETAHRVLTVTVTYPCRGAVNVAEERGKSGNVGARVESIAESSWKSNAIAEKGLVLP